MPWSPALFRPELKSTADMYTVGVGWGYQPIEKTGNLDELIDKSEDIWDLPSGACVQ